MAERHLLQNVTIPTRRLILREFRDDKVYHDYMYELESIPEVVRYQEWPPRTREQARQVVKTIIQSQSESPRTHIELAVFTEPDGLFIGRVGTNLAVDKQPIRATLWFAFMPHSQGKGYAFEAMSAFIQLLDAVGVKELEIECDPRNLGSRKLAERLEFSKVKEVDKAWESKGEWVGSVEYVRALE